MKRKIIQLANTTYVVSLPLKWIRKYGVKKKDEVEVTEGDSAITVSFAGKQEIAVKKTEIDITDLRARVAEWSLASLYKSGFDEIKVHYGSKEQLRFILNYVKEALLGFFVTEQTAGYCILKSVSREDGSEFDNLLRRSFLVGIELAESSLSLIEQGKYSEIQDLLHLEKTNNQLTMTCQRLIIKGLAKENPYELFLLARQLENVVDDYRDLCKEISCKKSLKLSKNTINLYSDINKYFRNYYEAFYNFDLKQLDALDKNKIEILNRLNDSLSKSPKNEIIILYFLLSITKKIAVFSTTIISINKQVQPTPA